MNCKHKTIETYTNTTTSVLYCKAKGKEINEYDCRDCMLRLPDLPEGFEEVFGKGFRR